MLTNRIVRQGHWLFRWRSFVPIIFAIPLAISLSSFHFFLDDHLYQHFWAASCLGISLVGLGVRAVTIGFIPTGTSGSNTHFQKAAALNVTGIYSLTRNPLYFGNFLIWLGIVASLHDPLLFFGFVLAFWLYYERIIAAEEQFLFEKFGTAYSDWAERTPIFVPQLHHWQSSDLKFSVKAVCGRDYTGLLGVCSAFFLLDVCEHVIVDHRLYVDLLWTAIFGFGLVTFLTLRILKKHTTLLRTSNR